MSDVIVAHFDPDSPTSGIQETIDDLGQAGGHVRIPAGKWPLRCSVVLRSNLSLVGDGPATQLTIGRPKALPLAQDARKGSRSIYVRGRVPFAPGDAIGLVDNRRQWWEGTHALVTSVTGGHIRLSEPLLHGLAVSREARVVGFFPAITTSGTGPPSGPNRKRTDNVVVRDLAIHGEELTGETVWDFTYGALHLVICTGLRVLGVDVFAWPSDGISVQSGSDVHVAHCQVSFCRGNGLHPGTGLARSVWSHNTAIGNGGDGLFLCSFVHDSVFSNSVFTGNSLSGIGGVGHAGDHHNIISDNVCSENARCGIDAFDGFEHVISGNMLRSNSTEQSGAHPALRLHSVQRFMVQGNRCADNQDAPTQTRGIVESGSSDWNMVSGNMCAGMAEPVTVIGPHSRGDGNLL